MDRLPCFWRPAMSLIELGGSYEDACAALDLPPVPGGYASTSLTR